MQTLFDQTIERAEVLYTQRRYDMALAEYVKVLAEEPDYDYAHTRMAMCLMYTGREKEALEEIETALNIDPNNEYSLYINAYLLRRMHRPKDALKPIVAAMELAPDYADYHAEAACIYGDLDNWPQSILESETAIKLDPNSERVWLGHAIIMHATGKFDAAHSAIDRVLELDPENLEAHGIKGMLLAERGRFSDALHYYREALRLDPNAEWARKGYLDALRARNPAYGIIVGVMNFKVPRIFFLHPAVMLVMVVICLIVGFAAVMVRYMAPHLLNVLIAFDPKGSGALDRQELRRARILGAYMLISWVIGIALIAQILNYWFVPAFCLVFMAPILVTRIFEFNEGRYQREATIYCGVGFLLVGTSLATSFFAPDPFTNYSKIWGIGDTSSTCLWLFIALCFFSRSVNRKEALSIV